MSRRTAIGLLLVVIAVVAVWWGYRAAAPKPQNGGEIESAPLAENIVGASATLSPERYALLSLRNGGRVSSIPVSVGQHVNAGDLLVQIVDADLRAAVAQAEATVKAAEADLARLRAGARPEQIAQAESALTAAEANLARLRAGARPEEIAQARAAVAAAEARLAQVRAGTRPEQLAILEAQVRQAETNLARAQDSYDRLRWVGGETERELLYQRDAAGAALATVRAQLAAAQAPAQPEEIAAAQASVDQAMAQLNRVRAGASAEEITAAEAQVAQARAQLALLKAGATPEEITAAQARVEAAKAALEQARALQAEATLRAPFAGTVTAINARVGEVVGPAVPVVTLADLSTLRLETDDLSETQIARVKLGQRARIVFEALPERSFQGQVTHIAPMSTLKQGGTNYAVTIVLDNLDPALRWGMTARVEIDTEG